MGDETVHGFLKAIETRYRGCRFRSRLEARWAVFFDALDIPWEYEKEGFDLGEAGWYLPDFWLPLQKTWYEVKGAAPTEDEETKIKAFCQVQPLLIAVGPLPDPDNVFSVYGNHQGYWWEPGYINWHNDDSLYLWCACRTGSHFGVEFEGRGARINCGCPGYEWGGRGIYLASHHRILNAYTAARSARFEHGERHD